MSIDLFAGMKLRQQVERVAYDMVQNAGGTKHLPVQSLTDFLDTKLSTGEFKSSSPSGVISAPLHEIFPGPMNEYLRRGFESFESKMPGFIHREALLHAVESRTSCPLRITRDKTTLQSLSHSGLYPTGEGAGYAGGITSAACDGIRVAEAIAELVKSTTTATSKAAD